MSDALDPETAATLRALRIEPVAGNPPPSGWVRRLGWEVAALPNRRNSPAAEIVWNGRRWRVQFGIVVSEQFRMAVVREIFVDPLDEPVTPGKRVPRLDAEWRSFVHDAAIDASLHLRAGVSAATMAKRYDRQKSSLLALMYAAAAEAESELRREMGA